MKLNRWTVALAAGGVIGLASAVQAEEAQNQVMTALTSTTLSGYVDTSAIWKFGTGNDRMPGRSYDGSSKQDGFNLNVVGLTLEKPLDESEWSAGYRVDLLFGPDATGYNTSANAVSGSSDFAVKQAYVNVRVPVGNGLDAKMGVFNSIIGYESFESYLNPNYSRSYGWFVEPTQHTGLLLSYRINDMIAVDGGVANTVTPNINDRPVDNNGAVAESQKTYMGRITLTAPEGAGFLKGANLYLGVVDGLPGGDFTGGRGTGTDVTSFYAGVTAPTPWEALKVGLAYDYRGVDSSDFTSTSYVNVIGGYLSWQVTEKLKLNTRTEYTWGSDGTYYTRGELGDSEARNELLGVTATADYSLWENVISRLEFRWDTVLTGGGNDAQKQFGGVTGRSDPDKNALSLALNLIYRF